jgi:non-heme chloroperoxidase
MLETDTNPEGLPLSVVDEIRAGVAGDRSQYYKNLPAPFYGANRPGSRGRRASVTSSGSRA